METSGAGKLLGLGLALVGAITMAVSTFLPLSQPAGVIGTVRSNSLIQHGGWELMVIAVGIAVSAVWAFQRNSKSWMWVLPVVGSVLAIAWIVFMAMNEGIRTLYPIGADGTVDVTKPGVVTPLDIALYVAGAGAAVSLLGSLVLKFGEQLPSRAAGSAPNSTGAPTRASKQCPDCAETILADAKVCKHCGYRFPTSKVKCNKCQHVQEVPRSLQTFRCSQCSQLLKRSVAT